MSPLRKAGCGVALCPIHPLIAVFPTVSIIPLRPEREYARNGAYQLDTTRASQIITLGFYLGGSPSTSPGVAVASAHITAPHIRPSPNQYIGNGFYFWR